MLHKWKRFARHLQAAGKHKLELNPLHAYAAAADGVGVSSAGSVMTATVRINRFFLVSFVLLLVAVLGLQLAKPEWMGLDLMSGSSGGAGGSGGMCEASREL